MAPSEASNAKQVSKSPAGIEVWRGLIRKDHDSDFGVDFPDFPGCISAGATLEEASRMAEEALELHVLGMVEDGDALPAPSSLNTIMADPDSRNTVAFIATVPGTVERSVRINDAHTRNRSAFLARAAEKALSEG